MQRAIKAAEKSLKRDTGEDMGIVITVAPMTSVASVANYISNIQLDGAITMLRSTADRLEQNR